MQGPYLQLKGSSQNLCAEAKKVSPDPDEIRRLVQEGAHLGARDSDGKTPLHLASRGGHDAVVTALLEEGAAVNEFTELGETPVFIASQMGHRDVVMTLLDHGATVDRASETGATPLLVATENGHVDVIRTLLDRGANANHVDKSGRSPLLVASHNGYDAAAAALLEKGATVSQVRGEGFTPLWIACQGGHEAVVAVLLEKGGAATVNQATSDGTTPLFLASHRGYDNLVTSLLDKGAIIDRANGNGATPLSVASQQGHDTVVKTLLRSGATVDQAKLDDGATPLYVASFNGHDAVVASLLEGGAMVDRPRKDGFTPLWIASQEGHDAVVALLLGNGASIDQVNKYGATPLFIASHRGHHSVVGALLDKGADVNRAMNNGMTPLVAACQEGHDAVVETLLQGGADTSLRFMKKRPRDIARKKRRVTIVALLDHADKMQRQRQRQEKKTKGSNCLKLPRVECKGPDADMSPTGLAECDFLNEICMWLNEQKKTHGGDQIESADSQISTIHRLQAMKENEQLQALPKDETCSTATETAKLFQIGIALKAISRYRQTLNQGLKKLKLASSAAVTISAYGPEIRALCIDRRAMKEDDVELHDILTDPTHRDFYLSLKTALRGNFIFSGGLTSSLQHRNHELLDQVRSLPRILGSSFGISGLAFAGGILSEILVNENRSSVRLYAGRLALFLSFCNEMRGGTEPVVRETAVTLLRTLQSQQSSNEDDSDTIQEEQSMWDRQLINKFRRKPSQTKAWEDGISAAWTFLCAILQPPSSSNSVVSRLLRNLPSSAGKSSSSLSGGGDSGSGQLRLPQILVAEALGIDLDSVRDMKRVDVTAAADSSGTSTTTTTNQEDTPMRNRTPQYAPLPNSVAVFAEVTATLGQEVVLDTEGKGCTPVLSTLSTTAPDDDDLIASLSCPKAQSPKQIPIQEGKLLPRTTDDVVVSGGAETIASPAAATSLDEARSTKYKAEAAVRKEIDRLDRQMKRIQKQIGDGQVPKGQVDNIDGGLPKEANRRVVAAVAAADPLSAPEARKRVEALEAEVEALKCELKHKDQHAQALSVKVGMLEEELFLLGKGRDAVSNRHRKLHDERQDEQPLRQGSPPMKRIAL